MNGILPIVFGAISEKDNMFLRDDVNAYEKYFGIGLNALMVINNILNKYNLVPKTILDLPSGFGRVTRFIRAAYPCSAIFASDINVQAVRFCSNFDAIPVYSSGNFIDLKSAIGVEINLVWTGSLITHLPESATIEYFKFISQILTPNGLAIMTSHGESIVDKMTDDCLYGLKKNEAINGSSLFQVGRANLSLPPMR
ncbi:SAM-dependent methyltransferase [Desulfomicrobium macestii]|uniref:SAM-dependent methyltransferase n=1 Tax=Desulfomicrobium macestii TaxID=90731 RepID=A0ABR9H9B6_9BACT|nr:hypothetical protein [Desulfomicrobium macestii]MBE1427301.1 SAM-dependent methyltransferase [Desulfomicrobium macestii]